ncbi:MAG: DNA sulfur modification protein DndD [Bacteroides sp.]|nr:DNA sulfur modification protein DndD [Bacteroides sp.]
MLIESITLTNYRLYKGENTLRFPVTKDKNIVLIVGENGFGKTTFLTSFLWCLYGRQMGEVESNYKKDVYTNGGYVTYLKSNLNRAQKKYLDELDLPEEVLRQIRTKGYTNETEYLREYAEYSVTTVFTNLSIPSLPCENITVTRSYDVLREQEEVKTLIDGHDNALYTDLGDDLFINDFILNRDLARFFFFDSEKIVSMAEMNSVADKRKLASAYNEVLGVKKYEDLKKNLENLQIRFRKRSADIESRDELMGKVALREKLQAQQQEWEKRLAELQEEIDSLKKENEELQVEMIRAGNSLSVEHVKRQERVLEVAKEKDKQLKERLKELMEYAPFAIAGNAFLVAKRQIDKESRTKKDMQTIQLKNDLVRAMKEEIFAKIHTIPLSEEQKKLFEGTVRETFDKFYKVKSDLFVHETLIEMSKEQYEELQAIYLQLTTTFKTDFYLLSDDYVKNRQSMERASRSIAKGTKENEGQLKELEDRKKAVMELLEKREKEYRDLEVEMRMAAKEQASLARSIYELKKKVSLDGNDAEKDRIAERLIDKLARFLVRLKTERKSSLEKRIRTCMNSLMHKEDFIASVEVEVISDMLEINLFDSDKRPIHKESLSKGEQQLYATSLLKALVDESGIKFPVFIDSPLQKFDKRHSGKIITEFYPQVSEQVVLFPLLFKELTEEEYQWMLPRVQKVYFIRNEEQYSYFEEVVPSALFQN